ncbi:MAG: flavodoxin family protein [Planctomycetes bacterium]|nr:flavodoxin family protein [Planctomycetota bacterium]
MSKKIVVLNGSPRANGNTAALIASFTKGAEEAGNSVTTFQLQTMNIKPCIGCYGGGKDPQSPCVQKDDMDKIYPPYKEADIVVFASPLYYWTISGQLKCAIDRLFAVAEINLDQANPTKDGILIMAGGSDEYEESIYWYDNLMKHLGWSNRGKVLAKDVIHIGDIDGKPELEEARILGASIK